MKGKPRDTSRISKTSLSFISIDYNTQILVDAYR